tara:strand:+ start:1343 stop:1711 length:369 start_codon:yes stop_codon:yes gene_type:complete
MATLAALEALTTKPESSATPSLVVAGHSRHTIISGTFKVEVNHFQQAEGGAFDDEDTFKTGLAAPLFATIQNSRDATLGGDIQDPKSATLDGVTTSATYKTITIRDVQTNTTAGVVIKVYGY